MGVSCVGVGSLKDIGVGQRACGEEVFGDGERLEDFCLGDVSKRHWPWPLTNAKLILTPMNLLVGAIGGI